MFPAFVHVYGEMKKDDDGFVSKKDLLLGVQNHAQKSQPSVYNYFRKIQHKFKTDKQGRSVYVKLIGDEE